MLLLVVTLKGVGGGTDGMGDVDDDEEEVAGEEDGVDFFFRFFFPSPFPMIRNRCGWEE